MFEIVDPGKGICDVDERAFRRVYSWEGNMLILTAQGPREMGYQ